MHIRSCPRLGADGAKSVRICYTDGRPTDMLLMVHSRFWFVQIGAYRQWKAPA